MLERVTHIRHWATEGYGSFKEFHRHYKFFPNDFATVGLLTKPGVYIDPIMRGLQTAPGSIGLMLDIQHNKDHRLSEKKAKRVRAAALLSLSGNYNFQLDEQSGLRLKVAIENPEACKYLAANVDTMVAFLRFLDDKKRLRHKEPSRIKVEGEGNNSIAFEFPQVKEVPKDSLELYTYIKPFKGDRANKRFGRLKLILW